MRRILPSLHGLRVFSAVARHRSFTHAGRDLNVQQPAVSRQIADLEDDLGVMLFLRTKPRLTMTEEGERLFMAVEEGFGRIEQTVIELRGSERARELTIDVTIGFASCWLLARIAEFQKRHPEVSVQIRTRDQNLTYDRDTSDVVILFGDGRQPDLETERVLRETMFPISSPDYPDVPDDLALEELATRQLLFLRDSIHERDWDIMLGSLDLHPRPLTPRSEFNSYIVYLNAVLNGEGIGIGLEGLLDDHLAAGRLHRIGSDSVTTERGYFAGLPVGRDPHPDARAFIDWLVERAGKAETQAAGRTV